jgi:hypothetical protein
MSASVQYRSQNPARESIDSLYGTKMLATSNRGDDSQCRCIKKNASGQVSIVKRQAEILVLLNKRDKGRMQRNKRVISHLKGTCWSAVLSELVLRSEIPSVNRLISK